MKTSLVFLTLLFFVFQPALSQVPKDTICILQLNDVYEIGALDRGRVGGLARVATLVKEYSRRYDTYLVLAGDFVGPSVIGTTKINGERVNGKQMVDMLNRAGLRLAIFGNHEFDIPDKDLQKRINESDFTWISSDVKHRDSAGNIAPFSKTFPVQKPLPVYTTLTSGRGQFKVAVVSATISSNKQPWVVYTNHLKAIKRAYRKAKRHSNVVVALTHLTLAEDKVVLHTLKKVPLIMGGHEHQHNYVTEGGRAIAKADANAKTMYRHLVYRTGTGKKFGVSSTLLQVDSTVLPDGGTTLAVRDWENKAYEAFRAIGLVPDSVLYTSPEPLDGREASIRYKQTNLGTLIAQAMLSSSTQSDAAVFNSGSIRIDDMINGTINELDIIRILPFGGKLCEVKLTGGLLIRMLTTGNALKGVGGYLQYTPNITLAGNTWQLNGKDIDPSKLYNIISSEFLFSGAEKGLEFLKEGNSEIQSVTKFDAPADVRTDVRLAVVQYLSQLKK